MSFNKRRLVKTLLTANKGGCGCTKLKPSDVLDPTPIPKISVYQHTNPSTSSLTSSTTTSGGDDLTSTTISEADTSTHDHHGHNNNKHSSTIPIPISTKLVNSVAVEKDSEDPHGDFRNSMLQMILEREICSEIDLQELLECFLKLNAPCHRKVIVQAFMEICEETFPKKKLRGDGEAWSTRRNHDHQIIRKSR